MLVKLVMLVMLVYKYSMAGEKITGKNREKLKA
jgi:hypothetical protein